MRLHRTLFPVAIFFLTFQSPFECTLAYQQAKQDALVSLLKSAEEGNAVAQLSLGQMYANGAGVTQDCAEALKWHGKAADQDFAPAQTSLGQLYFEGTCVTRDYAEALKWYRKAADHGFSPAQFMMGRIYSEGKGVSPDYIQAYMWFDLSGKIAESHRDTVAARMTSDQIVKAQGLALQWKTAHGQIPMIGAGKPGESPAGSDGPYIAGQGGVKAPVALFRPLPPYTDEARKVGIQGNVILQCIIRKDGTVDSFKVLEGLGHGLDESAINTIATKWRFQPGTLDGKPVDVQANISVSFKLWSPPDKK